MAERGPSGTGHDTARIWTPGQHDQHCAARQGGVCGRFDGCYPPGPASVSPAEPPEDRWHGLYAGTANDQAMVNREALAALLAERDELRRCLYEAAHELPVSDAPVARHSDLQRLHRRIIAALREEEPDGAFVTYDYWLGRTP